jgi:predicted ATPase
MSIREKIIIKNFFSIKEFEWDVKGFNILTGGMASGKSLALKLLYFCEQVFHKTIFEVMINRELFQKENFFNKISTEFNKIFMSRDQKSDYHAAEIGYFYEFYENQPKPQKDQTKLFEEEILTEKRLKFVFDLSAAWDGTELHWSSKYIESKLKTWQTFFTDQNKPELAERVRNRVFESISSDFSENFPMSAMFIPASRAVATISSVIRSRDIFIQQFMELKDFALSFNDTGVISSETVNKLLLLQKISLENDKDKNPLFKLLDGRDIGPLELSSGQQELLYLLLLIDDLKRSTFDYGYDASIFIEEPSAHLFPKEQKETMEFLVASYNELKETRGRSPSYRFFISTHSPYVLNTINNLIEKDRLLKIAEKITDPETKHSVKNKIKDLPFPRLSIEYVSAYMIEKDGSVKPMIKENDDEPYIYSDVIDRINQEITDGTEKLSNLDSEIKKSILLNEKKSK